MKISKRIILAAFALAVALGIAVFDGVHRFVGCTATCTFGVWCHVAGTYDGAELKVYVNGALSGTLAYVGLAPSAGQSMRIGQRFNGTLPFKGLIDEVEV